MNMDLILGPVEPINLSPPPLSHPDNTVLENAQLGDGGERSQLVDWDVPNDSAESHDSTSATSSSAAQEPQRDSGNCDAMIEKWHSIRLADKIADKTRARKKVFHPEAITRTGS